MWYSPVLLQNSTSIVFHFKLFYLRFKIIQYQFHLQIYSHAAELIKKMYQEKVWHHFLRKTLNWPRKKCQKQVTKVKKFSRKERRKRFMWIIFFQFWKKSNNFECAFLHVEKMHLWVNVECREKPIQSVFWLVFRLT